MSVSFFRMNDANLMIWSSSFSQHINATSDPFHVTKAQAGIYETLNVAFDSALAIWRDQSTKTPVASANKKAARANLLAMARFLVNSINSNPETTPAQRDQLGIKARKRPSSIPAPKTSPVINVVSVNGRVVSLMLKATTAGKRGKPTGVAGSSVFTFVGAVSPTDPAQWKFEGLLTRTKFELSFIDSTAANTVWVTANWYNERGETGAACSPVSINLPASVALPSGEKMKIAA